MILKLQVLSSMGCDLCTLTVVKQSVYLSVGPRPMVCSLPPCTLDVGLYLTYLLVPVTSPSKTIWFSQYTRDQECVSTLTEHAY